MIENDYDQAKHSHKLLTGSKMQYSLTKKGMKDFHNKKPKVLLLTQKSS